MSVKRRELLTLPLALTGLVASSRARAQEESPDREFLEYLGSWEGSDEEWLTVAGDTEPQIDRADAGERRVERDEDDQES